MQSRVDAENQEKDRFHFEWLRYLFVRSIDPLRGVVIGFGDRGRSGFLILIFAKL